MERLKAYRFRIYPTKEQEIFFGNSFGYIRNAYNPTLDHRMKAYKKTKIDFFKK